MKIWNLTPENAPAIEQVAELLVAGFGDTGSASWRILGEAIEEVQNSLQPGRISRIAVNEQLVVLGWIGGIEEYDGNVWELHPLFVRQDCRRQSAESPDTPRPLRRADGVRVDCPPS